MSESPAAPAPAGWLVVIDMQNAFGEPSSPWCTPGFGELLPVHRELIARFESRVVFTRFVAPRTPYGAWVDYYRQWPFALVEESDPLYDLADALPHPGHPVVSRTTFGKWDHLPGSLPDVVGDAGSIAVIGVSTDCCVLSTVLAAADDGMRVQVVADACAGISTDDHDRALDAMALYAPLVTITTSDELLRVS